MFSHFMTGENKDCNSEKVKRAPIYQIEADQKAPPKVKHTGITQKSPNWSWQLENIKCLQKKINKMYKKYWNIRVTPAGLKNGSSNLTDGSVPKDPAQSQTHQYYSKIPKLVPTPRNHQKSAKKKPNKI